MNLTFELLVYVFLASTEETTVFTKLSCQVHLKTVPMMWMSLTFSALHISAVNIQGFSSYVDAHVPALHHTQAKDITHKNSCVQQVNWTTHALFAVIRLQEESRVPALSWASSVLWKQRQQDDSTSGLEETCNINQKYRCEGGSDTKYWLLWATNTQACFIAA